MVPVVLAYVLGKSHEAMKILAEAGHKLMVHGSIAVLANVYEAVPDPEKCAAEHSENADRL